MKITEHFSIEEFEKSRVAQKNKIDNSVPRELIPALTKLCVFVLEPVRELAGVPVRISSGYRCNALNYAVGSKNTSQHLKCEAADIVYPGDTRHLFDKIKNSDIIFDQVIYEKKGRLEWIHISYRDNPRRRAFEIGP